jgi:bacterioferritin-associated ferredoxin
MVALRLSLKSIRVDCEPEMSSTVQAPATTDRIVCHCLAITESQIRRAVEVGGSQCLRDVMAQTAAGTGCTACHARIRQHLNAASAEQPVQSESSPICWAT